MALILNINRKIADLFCEDGFGQPVLRHVYYDNANKQIAMANENMMAVIKLNPDEYEGVTESVLIPKHVLPKKTRPLKIEKLDTEISECDYLASGKRKILFKSVKDKYPNYTSVSNIMWQETESRPVSAPVELSEIGLNPEYFGRFDALFSAFGNGNRGVKLTFYGKTKAIKVTPNNDECTHSVYGVIMPVKLITPNENADKS